MDRPECIAQLVGLLPPFSYVLTMTVAAGVYFSLLILITQRHENQLTDARAQLALGF